jgi:hypothetical protein
MLAMEISITILSFFITTFAFSQKQAKEPNWKDTTYVLVNLPDTINDNKIVVIYIGEKAAIYLSAKFLKQDAIESSNDFNKKDISKIILLLNKLSLKSDTLIIDQFMKDLDFLVSDLLQNGNPKVFYKKTNSFAATISYRLEKYGMYAVRFFYLPDKKPFFSTMEYIGIIENNKFHSDRDELAKLGEKLASMRQE